MFEITEKELRVEEIVKRVSSPSAGAISTFIGTTRNFTGDRKVSYLFYEAYDSMALQLMSDIAEEARSSFHVEKVAITHRIGRVNLEEASVVIAVSSSHREEAFRACRFIIDTLKEIVPIWKKEFMEDGSQEWIGNRTVSR